MTKIDYSEQGRKLGRWLWKKLLSGIDGLLFILTVIAGVSLIAACLVLVLGFILAIIAAPFIAVGWGFGAGFSAFCWMAPIC